MTAWEEIERARSQKLVDEDGRPVQLVTAPPLSDDEIEGVARRVGAALPLELVELLLRRLAEQPGDDDASRRAGFTRSRTPSIREHTG